ncbi:hypothetical protein RDWZM_004469, partial [Blomia tropicalis]
MVVGTQSALGRNIVYLNQVQSSIVSHNSSIYPYVQICTKGKRMGNPIFRLVTIQMDKNNNKNDDNDSNHKLDSNW